MTYYMENAAHAVAESSVAVMVLVNPDATDIVFWRLRPERAAESDLTTREEFAARKLRSVGVVGLCGLTPVCSFKESLETPVVNSIVVGFLQYIRDSLSDSLVELREAAEIAALECLFTLPDMRII
jgi:hypothetical protein